ncbi:MAG: hypothetical protein FJ146_13515 [Deltaproteobacteria bacterium]|nr:hypothetical protein [Deltaproteobacteria bacterium]
MVPLRPKHLTDELHCHLYGCLTPEDLWLLGRDRFEKVVPRLAWYAEEYEKAYGRRPDSRQYWSSDAGLDLLRRDFLFTSAHPFARFQASFNLAIALLPITPGDTTVLSHVMHAQAASGITYGEYRLFAPPHLGPDDLRHYFAVTADRTLELAAKFAGSFAPKIVFSIMRRHEVGLLQYQILKEVLDAKPQRYDAVVAIDFCGMEEHHPPQFTAPLVRRILADNTACPEKGLAVLYHVGESFADKTLASAVRWVSEAQALGVHRLGHALALGINPDLYIGHTVSETAGERRRHLQWLLASRSWLGSQGYDIVPASIESALKVIAGAPEQELITTTWTSAVASDCARLQDAVMSHLRDHDAIIESCPTSNMLIGNLSKDTHPLPRFMASGLSVIIGADDPGIFATSLAREEERLMTEFGWSAEQLGASQRRAQQSRSTQLVRPF